MRILNSIFVVASCSSIESPDTEIISNVSTVSPLIDDSDNKDLSFYYSPHMDEDSPTQSPLADETLASREEIEEFSWGNIGDLDDQEPAAHVAVFDAVQATIEVKESAESPVYRNSNIGVEGALLQAPSGFTGTSTYELFARGLGRNDVRGAGVGSFGMNTGKKYEWLTYEDMDTQSRLFGSGLLALNLLDPIVDSENRAWRMLGIYAEHRFQWTVTELAASRQNVTLVPIYETSKPDFVLSILKQTQLSVIVASVSKAESLLRLMQADPQLTIATIILMGDDFDRIELYGKFPKSRIAILTAAEVKGAARRSADNLPSLDDANTICFTSGTTGEPKGVVVTHRMLIAVVGAAVEGNLGLNFKDVHVAYLPPAHIFERIVDLTMMYLGGKIGYHSGDMKQLAVSMRLIKPTVLAGVPRVYEKSIEKVLATVKNASSRKQRMIEKALGKSAELMKNGDFKLSSMPFMDRLVLNKMRAALGGRVRIILSGGGALAPATQEMLTSVFHVPVVQGYGMTETTGGTMLTQVYSKLNGVVGLPMSCVEVKLANMQHHSAFHGAGAGELYVRGPSVFKEYFNKPEATAAAIEDGWVKTGDVAQMITEQGETVFKIVGRAKEMFKLENGEYIVPAFVEQEYKQCSLVDEIFIDASVDQKATVAIVNVKETEVWAMISKMTNPVSFPEMVASQEFNTELMNCLRNTESKLGKTDRIRAFHVSPTSFGAETDFQTATMKFKREVIRKYFVEQIALL